MNISTTCRGVQLVYYVVLYITYFLINLNSIIEYNAIVNLYVIDDKNTQEPVREVALLSRALTSASFWN